MEIWNWRGDLDNPAVAELPFVPQSHTLSPCAFHSGPPTQERLSGLIDPDWRAGLRVCVYARIHKQGRCADTRIGPLTFTLAGSREECAKRLCEIIRRAFASHTTRPLDVTCEVITDAAGNATIRVACADGTIIDAGHLDVIGKTPPPVVRHIWDVVNRGLWRREFRRREIARCYRHYEWTPRSLSWFNRRAEGFWITGQALITFTCSGHCGLRNLNGTGFWRIIQTFRRVDVRRFREHYRTTWIGHLNPVSRNNPQFQNRFAVSLDHVEVVVPMEPEDPDPATPGINEAVVIVDELGERHFLGEPGFQLLPDTAQNPNGFQLITTAFTSDDLPPAPERIQDPPMQPGPGMAQIEPGVVVEWLADDQGHVLANGGDVNGEPRDILRHLGWRTLGHGRSSDRGE